VLTRPARLNLFFVVSLLANVALAGGLAYLLFLRPGVSPRPAAPAGAKSAAASTAIEALGRVQPAGGVVSVFGPPGDRIISLGVDLGSQVEKGQQLATLAGTTERKLSVQAIDAQLKEAEALRASIQKSRDAKLADLKQETEQATEKAKGDIQALDAKITGLEAQLKQARAERARLANVESQGVRVSEQEKSQADLLVTQAEQQLIAARAQRRTAADVLATAPQAAEAKRKAIEAEADRALAQVPYESLKASKQVAERKLADAMVRAPVSGRVVKVFARAGDTLANQPILQIANTEQMTVLAEVYETDVARLRDWLNRSPNHEVAAEVDARVLDGQGEPQALHGTVTPGSIAPMIAKNSVYALGPREDTDRRVVEVEVKLDPASSRAVANFIGLQVRVRFLGK
jgi:HlyD family secretion protein